MDDHPGMATTFFPQKNDTYDTRWEFDPSRICQSLHPCEPHFLVVESLYLCRKLVILRELTCRFLMGAIFDGFAHVQAQMDPLTGEARLARVGCQTVGRELPSTKHGSSTMKNGGFDMV